MYDLPPPPKPFVFFAKKRGALPFAAIIKIPPKVVEDKYQDLVCTNDHRDLIHELITGMAENGKLELLFNVKLQDRLREIGVIIEPVHPLRFLGVIFSNSDLKGKMRKVFEDYFKRTEFLDGLIPGMARQHEKGKLAPFISEFAKEVNISENDLRPYFQTFNWEGLVRRLIGI